MINNRNNITEMPYAKWLEQTLHDISSLPVKGIALLVSTENGDSYTNYYNVSMALFSMKAKKRSKMLL